MSLTSKIMALATLIALAGAAWIYESASRFDALYQERTRTLTETSLQIQLARTMQVDFKKQVQEWKDILLRGRDPDDLAKYKEQFSRQETRVRESIERLLKTQVPPEARAKVEEFERTHRALGESYREALGRYEQTKDAADADRRVRGLDRVPTDRIDQVVAEIEAAARESGKQATRAWEDEGTRNHALSAVLVAILLGMAWTLSRSLTRPLVDVSKIMKRVTKGEEYSFRMPGQRDDEIGSLMSAFNDMLSAIQERDRRIQDAGARIAEREERLRSLTQAVSDGILFTDADAAVLGWNKGAESIFGYSELEMIGKPLAMILPSWSQERLDRELQGSPGAKAVELEGLRKDGSTVHVEFSLAVWQSGGRSYFGGILRDITEQMKVDRLKDEFISVVNHELRTPLTAIRGALGLVASGIGGALPPAAKSIIDIANRNSERLARLVNDILDMEKIEAGKMVFQSAPADLPALLEQSLEANRSYAATFGVTLSLRGPVEADRVHVDADRFAQVLANLLSNAVKFSPKGASVDVSTEQRGALVRISVRDHGPGIPDEFRRRIFEKFAQAQTEDARVKQGQGTGLGLSITKAIVERMGGQIGFSSAVGEGTTFYVDLPRVVAGEARGGQTKGPGRLLLCLTEGAKSDDLERFLESRGYPTRRASCPSEAEARLRSDGISAAVVDPAWARGETFATLGAILREAGQTELPVLGLSDRGDDSGAAQGSGLGRILWVSPRDPEKGLLSALHRAIPPGRGRLARLFHVSNSPETLALVREAFQGLSFVTDADTLEQGWQHLRRDSFDLLIMDIHLRDGCALELLPLLPGVGKEKMPVIVLSDVELSGKAAALVDLQLPRSKTTAAQLQAAVQSLLRPISIDRTIPRSASRV